jgi:hypothetical protein
VLAAWVGGREIGRRGRTWHIYERVAAWASERER